MSESPRTVSIQRDGGSEGGREGGREGVGRAYLCRNKRLLEIISTRDEHFSCELRIRNCVPGAAEEEGPEGWREGGRGG